ncbi:hypothetical protein [Amycolatopsis kentuckyensis]|uniref:hypothetical protein n=1 Tax=Amycolatopsis kentuckyensis TaxID=218823 RepID=UPI0035673EFD
MKGSSYALRYEIRDPKGRRVGELVPELHAAIAACQVVNDERDDAHACVVAQVYVPVPIR